MKISDDQTSLNQPVDHVIFTASHWSNNKGYVKLDSAVEKNV